MTMRPDEKDSHLPYAAPEACLIELGPQETMQASQTGRSQLEDYDDNAIFD